MNRTCLFRAMPSSLMRVFRVDPSKAQGRRPESWLISGVYLPQSSLGLQVDTINPWFASLCQRAKETGQPIHVEWRETKWGRDLLRAELVREEQIA